MDNPQDAVVAVNTENVAQEPAEQAAEQAAEPAEPGAGTVRITGHILKLTYSLLLLLLLLILLLLPQLL